MFRTLGAAFALSFLAPVAMAQAPAQAPTVVELYQSQGCSSCPPANAWLNGIAGRADVLALSFAVTYWDQLGWKDTFASPAYTDRQRDHAAAIGRGTLVTPEVVVNGRRYQTGGDRQKLDGLLAAGRKDALPAAVKVSSDGVTIAATPGSKPADVWLVRYDPREVAVPIRAGENGGRTLPHRNIVRQLVKLGRYEGAEVRFTLPPAPLPGLRTAALVQAGKGGPIIGAGVS